MATRFAISCTDCPFTGRYRSLAMAESAYGKHSCERHLRRAADAAQRLARESAVDRTPKPCLHKIANHQHGTYACYVLDGCRCLPCSTANSNYEANRARQQAYGRWNGLVDADPARQHIRSLMSQGMGLKRIAAISGASTGVLWKLLYGKPGRNGNSTPSKRIQPHTAERLLAVDLELADGALVDSTSSARRLQSLVALGWSMSKLATRLGVLPTNFGPIIHGQRQITVANAKAVRALYEELALQAPPESEWRDKIAAGRSRNYARQHHWSPPVFLGRGVDRRPHPIDDAQFRVLEEDSA